MTYPMRPLADALIRVERKVAVDPAATYKMLGVRSFGRGAFAAGDLPGVETSYSTLLQVSQNDIVYPKLMAWEGAFALVPPELGGRYVSTEFCTFSASSDTEPRFVAYALSTPWIAEAVAGSSGGTNVRRRRLYPDDFLAKKIPLPDPDEQRRIAIHLDRVASRLNLFRQRRETTITRLVALGASLATQPQLSGEKKECEGWRQLRLGEVMTEANDVVDVKLDHQYPNLGIYSFGRGVFAKPPIDGLETSAKKLNRIRSGQFVYSRLFAFEGAYAYVPEEFDGVFVSNEFPSFDVDPEQALAPFIAAALRSPRQWGLLAGSSKGLGLRRQRIKVDALLEHRLWFPPIEQQRRVVAGLERIGRLESLVAHSDDLAAAVSPSALNRAFAGLA